VSTTRAGDSADAPVPPRSGWYRRRGKRLSDLVLVVASSPLWLPLVAATAVIVRCRMGTPVLFRQPRPGYREVTFAILKFRTMTNDRGPDGAPLSDAERLTRFGRWLRRTSLDELPELFNVLRGDMSLVGPRPLLVEYLDRYSEEQHRRHEVKPGLTGWAQINGRNAISWPEKFALDVWYVDHQSLALDVRILWRSLARIAGGEGINQPGSATAEAFLGNSPGEEER